MKYFKTQCEVCKLFVLSNHQSKTQEIYVMIKKDIKKQQNLLALKLNYLNDYDVKVPILSFNLRDYFFSFFYKFKPL